MIIRTGNIDFYINMFLAKSRNDVCNTGPLFRWTCFQHNRKCCFLLSSCRLLLLTLLMHSDVVTQLQFLLFGKYIFQYQFVVTRDLSYKYPYLLNIYVCYSLVCMVQLLARASDLCLDKVLILRKLHDIITTNFINNNYTIFLVN